MVFKKEDLILNFDRIRADVTTFIRGNPLITAGIGLGTPLAIVGISKIRKKRKKAPSKRKPKRKTKSRKKVSKRRKKVTHRSPRHKGHKVVTFTTKDGKKVRFKVAKKPHTHRRKRR